MSSIPSLFPGFKQLWKLAKDKRLVLNDLEQNKEIKKTNKLDHRHKELIDKQKQNKKNI